MNILLISPTLKQGGFQRICVSTARLLDGECHVTIATFNMDDVAYDIEGLDVVNLNLPAVPGPMGKVINILKRRKALNRLISDKGIDVVYSFGTTANKAACIITSRVRKLMACHSFEELKNVPYMRAMGRCADVIFCCAEAMTEYVHDRYGLTQVKTLWNPCDIDAIQDASHDKNVDVSDVFSDSEQRVMLTMGREDDVKGYWHMLKIFRAVHEIFPNTKLAILGSGNFEEYKTLAGNLDIEKNVIFTGNRLNPFPYLARADIFLMTSVSEGLPNVLVEALALSVPIVSVNCPTGPAEILHCKMEEVDTSNGAFYADNGILTPPIDSIKDMSYVIEKDGHILLDESERLMADAIINLLSDDELRQKYIDKAAKRASDFSAKAYINNLEQFI